MDIKNILLIRLRLLGDIILTIPSITLIKNKYPNCNIYYIVEEEFEGIGRLLPHIKELIVIPKKTGIYDMLKLGRKIKKYNFDTLIDFHSGPKSSQISLLSGIKKKIGYNVPFRSWIYSLAISRKQEKPYIHSVYNQIRLLEGIGIKTNKKDIPPYPQIIIDKENISRKIIDVITKEKKIVIHIGAGNNFRDWGTKKYTELSKLLINDGFSVFLIGHGTYEENRGKEIEQKAPVYNFTGQISIKESLFLIQYSNIYFGVDSGPLHLASLTKTPIVAIYGPNVTAISGPWRQDNITILESNMNCRPCNQRVCIYGKNNDTIKCMKNIGVNEAYEAIIKYIR